MMNDLNTLVQFLSAIYLTITIDNLMFNRFWTADLYSLTEKSLYEFDFCLSSPKKKALLDVIKSRAVITEQIARRRGGYFLLFCLSLLVFFSLETSLNSELRAVAHFFFIPTLMFVGIEYIIGIFQWNSWKRIFIYYSLVMCKKLVASVDRFDKVVPLTEFLGEDNLSGKPLLVRFVNRSLDVISF